MSEISLPLAKIGAAHGIKGEVRVKPYGEPDMLDQYGMLHDQAGSHYKITRMRQQKSMLVVKFEGVDTRNEAEALNGIELFVERSKLPKLEDEGEFYVEELIGMKVVDSAGASLGKVIAVPNFGAGDLLEISLAAGGSILLQFTKEVVPEIDFENSTLQVNPPAEVSERDEEPGV